MFIANSQEELIPLQQPQEMVAALQRFGVPHQLDILPGELHAQEYAPQVMQPTVAFMQTYLEPAKAAGHGSSGSGSTEHDDHLTWILASVAGLALVAVLMGMVVLGGRRRRRRRRRLVSRS
jgi:hypothetical protein